MTRQICLRLKSDSLIFLLQIALSCVGQNSSKHKNGESMTGLKFVYGRNLPFTVANKTCSGKKVQEMRRV